MNHFIEDGEAYILKTYNRFPVVLDRGDGVNLYDTDGKEYLDFGAGIAVFALGYGNREYNDALKAQIDKLIHTLFLINILTFRRTSPIKFLWYPNSSKNKKKFR